MSVKYFGQFTNILIVMAVLIVLPVEVFSSEISEAKVAAREWIREDAKQGSPDA
jgi:hypothetical protein